MQKEPAERVEREQADERNRSANGPGNERVAPDPAFEREPVTQKHEHGGGDEQSAIAQTLLPARQLAERSRELAPSPALDVDRQRNRRDVGKPGSADRDKRPRGASSRIGVCRGPPQEG